MRNTNYVLITGASEGFGKAMAMECAGRGMNIILVALPGSGLNELADSIIKDFKVDVLYFEHDLSQKEECYQVYNEIKNSGWPVNMLINNAGIGGTHAFEEKNAEFYYRQIELNVMAPTLITHQLLGILEKNSPSHILNVASLAGIINLPLKQVYGGTKSYLVSFSKSLRKELKGKGVSVSIICPGGMNTNPQMIFQNHCLTGISKRSIMNPDEVARIAIDGTLKNKELIIPGFWNKFFVLLNIVLPKWLKGMIADNHMKKIRNINKQNPVTPLPRPMKTKSGVFQN